MSVKTSIIRIIKHRTGDQTQPNKDEPIQVQYSKTVLRVSSLSQEELLSLVLHVLPLTGLRVLQLRPVKFTFTTDGPKKYHFNDKKETINYLIEHPSIYETPIIG